jgi:aminoglycoside phosphotransferase (APT) family kinase protein
MIGAEGGAMSDTDAARAGADGPPEMGDMQRSSRDPEQLRTNLERWLTTTLGPDSAPVVPEIAATSANGMSSDTVLFRADWVDEGNRRSEALVARVAPDPNDVPVFPTYDLARQFEVIRLVGDLAAVPVPRMWWLEPSAAPLGSPFFVMERIDGEVPPDVMPYNFGDSWLFDATVEDQRKLQDTTVEVLAELHSIEEVDEQFGFLAFDDAGDTALRRHVAHSRSWYEFAHEGHRSSLIERGFAWLDDHWPSHEGQTVVSWGDSRIGNVMYRDYQPVAVLDWEMAGLGPRELDLAWLVNAHCVFEHLATGFELPGMPGFLRLEDVAQHYERLTGHTPRDLEFYMTYAAVEWAIVFLRTGLRAVHFGERDMPDDIHDLMHHRGLLEMMLAGEYWK